MKTPSDNVIRAHISLESNTFWQDHLEWLRESLFTQAIANSKLSGEATIKGQGKCLELEEILNHIKKAREYEQNAKDAKRMERKGGG